MKYDFESIMNRYGKDAIAVDSLGKGDPSFTPRAPQDGFDCIPMWVADMNFPACPTIPKAITERVQHPAYGYFEVRDEYYEKIIRWHEKQNGACQPERDIRHGDPRGRREPARRGAGDRLSEHQA